MSSTKMRDRVKNRYEGNTSSTVAVKLEELIKSGLYAKEFGSLTGRYSAGRFNLVLDPPYLSDPLYITQETPDFFAYVEYFDRTQGLKHWDQLVEDDKAWEAERLSNRGKDETIW